MSEKRKDNKGRILRTGESQRKDKTYMYRYFDGSTRKCIYAPTLDELREKEDALAQEVYRLGKLNLVSGSGHIHKDMSILELVQVSVSQRNSIKPHTKEAYEFLIKQFGDDPFLRQRFTDIRISMAKGYAIQLERQGKAYNSIKCIISLIKSSYNDAIEDDIIGRNPFAFRLSKVLTVKPGKRTSLTPEEQRDLLDYIWNHPHHRKKWDEINILIETGLRVSELCGLTIPDIDFANRCITVNKQLIKDHQMVLHVVPPKSQKGYRQIPMSKSAEASFRRVLLRRSRVQVEPIIDGYGQFLFLTTRGAPLTAHTLECSFRRIKEDYNRDKNGSLTITPHVLRHTFCTNLVNDNMNIKSVQYLMGHATADTTLDVYSHADYNTVAQDFFRRERTM